MKFFQTLKLFFIKQFPFRINLKFHISLTKIEKFGFTDKSPQLIRKLHKKFALDKKSPQITIKFVWMWKRCCFLCCGPISIWIYRDIFIVICQHHMWVCICAGVVEAKWQVGVSWVKRVALGVLFILLKISSLSILLKTTHTQNQGWMLKKSPSQHFKQTNRRPFSFPSLDNRVKNWLNMDPCKHIGNKKSQPILHNNFPHVSN